MRVTVLSLCLMASLLLQGQTISSPAEFLGYPLGTAFTPHHRVVAYYEHLAETLPNQVVLQTYGHTYEGRPLLLATLSTTANIQRLDAIREAHLNNRSGQGSSDVAIVWLSYNVHGNESVSTEASMQTIYALLTEKAAYLDNTVVLIDPSVNPDGRDRYVNWYKQFRNSPFTVDPNSKEHHEGWLNGRPNHYMFDLNRDWAWLTQVESQQRIVQYNKWMPHIHVDFHEQGVDNPYFFAPAAEPFHEVITDFQRDFQETIGKNHAQYFDAEGWFYFTKEVFDLFYPSYGDTYPTYNGAIGMTYEQGGSGRAGLGILTRNRDTLTLKDRIDHHHTTGLSTVEVASQNAAKLNSEFQKFHQNQNYRYKNYVLHGNGDRMGQLTQLLDKHQIQYGTTSNKTIKGFGYGNAKEGNYKLPDNSLVVPTDQLRGTLVKVLFEPQAKLSDSLTYDITAWSLPYAYGLEAVATGQTVPYETGWQTNTQNKSGSGTYAYVTDWNSMEDARFLAALLQANYQVRTAHNPFSIAGQSFDRGSLIITKADNSNIQNFSATLPQLAAKHHKTLTAIGTGFMDSGKDLGSSSVTTIPRLKIAALSGGPTSSLQFGEVWHFFEQQLYYPLTVLDDDYLSRVTLTDYDVLILPSGRYGKSWRDAHGGQIEDFVRAGGKLIVIGGAIGAMDKESLGLATHEQEKEQDSTNAPTPHAKGEREYIKSSITGAIFKATVDPTHPMAYGYDDHYFTLKLGSSNYKLLDDGNVAYLENAPKPVSGFAGSEALKQLDNTLVFGVQNHGRGQVVYMVDNPLFRGFWENGKLFFANALFMVD